MEPTAENDPQITQITAD